MRVWKEKSGGLFFRGEFVSKVAFLGLPFLDLLDLVLDLLYLDGHNDPVDDLDAPDEGVHGFDPGLLVLVRGALAC